ncbi:MAG TPA: hypothetical protein VFC05_15275 [Nitrososphaeraceae archaeon]|nr:hypothetical protein [Nitrososphaeraceae archaeon]
MSKIVSSYDSVTRATLSYAERKFTLDSKINLHYEISIIDNTHKNQLLKRQKVCFGER